MRGADALIAALEAHGADTVFGVPGGAALPLYDALAASGRIRHVLTRHEAAAGHAAEGWARVTGRPGVALATSGPGAVNLLTAVADAWMDSVPVVFVCGQVATHLRGTMAFQECDVAGMSVPVVKHSMTAQPGDDLGALADQAFALAAGGRPGPVLLEVPVDVAKAPAARRRGMAATPERARRARPAALAAAAAELTTAQRPRAAGRRRGGRRRRPRRAARAGGARGPAGRHDAARPRVRRRRPLARDAGHVRRAGPRTGRSTRRTASSPSARASTTASPDGWTRSPRTRAWCTSTSTRPSPDGSCPRT